VRLQIIKHVPNLIRYFVIIRHDGQWSHWQLLAFACFSMGARNMCALLHVRHLSGLTAAHAYTTNKGSLL